MEWYPPGGQAWIFNMGTYQKSRADPNPDASGLMKLYFCIGVLFLTGSQVSGDVEKLKPENPQRSELQSMAFKAKELIPDASPKRPIPQLYRAWRNPVPQTKRPGDKLLSVAQIQLTLKLPQGELSAWDKKKWKSGKPIRSPEVKKGYARVLEPLSMKDFQRMVYKRNRNMPHGDSRKARQER